jgi:nucleoid-associated protein YgaU
MGTRFPSKLFKGDEVGLFDKKTRPKADFSNVRSGSSTSAPDTGKQPEIREAEARYTVRKGDSLSAIAQREYGDASAWRRIYDANRDLIQNPDLIHPGQVLTIPRTDRGVV